MDFRETPQFARTSDGPFSLVRYSRMSFTLVNAANYLAI
jgi:hypothetical protein